MQKIRTNPADMITAYLEISSNLEKCHILN